ncbi:MAG: DUF4931 domain-containing protein [Thermoplasmata archaeon]
MSELRVDPITGRWVVIAASRLARPSDYATPAPSPDVEDCPFCEGHEGRTPAEIEAVRRADSGADRPGWSVRTIPNKFPTLAREAPLPSGPGGDEAHAARPGTGIHEVIIQNPRHGPGLPFLTAEHRRSIFGMFRQRVRALGEEPGVRSVLLFENAGPESGGTLYHPHAQVVALPLVPPNLEEELAGAERWTLSHDGACGWESVARAERALRTRLVWEDPTLVAFAPWAPQYPYEVLVMATHHSARFSESSDEEIDRLAEVVPAVLRAILKVEPRASYNYFLHTLPGTGPSPGFHWHFHIAPRLVRPDGFELGTGIPVNPMAPEGAAQDLRSNWDL